jgi:tetratricopeptide (TPR) repeat protein
MQGRFDRGVAYYTRAVELNPTSAPYQSNLGIGLQDASDAAEAAAYHEAIRLDPTLAEAHCNLGEKLKARAYGPTASGSGPTSRSNWYGPCGVRPGNERAADHTLHAVRARAGALSHSAQWGHFRPLPIVRSVCCSGEAGDDFADSLFRMRKAMAIPTSGMIGRTYMHCMVKDSAGTTFGLTPASGVRPGWAFLNPYSRRAAV